MTLEEVKAEAKKYGYGLIPLHSHERLLPCVCGCKRRERWYGGDGSLSLVCKQCGRTIVGKSENKVIRLWNAEMQRLDQMWRIDDD